jgi:hypothetical protein
MALQTKQSLGDVIDRVTILLLKAYYFNDEAYELKNVVKELGHILPELLDFTDGEWRMIQESLKDLRNINRDLWHLEELIRQTMRGSDSDMDNTIVQLVKQIHEKNNDRADVKRWINDELDIDFAEMKNYESTSYKKPPSSS